jgi:hypothetical protein
LSPGTDTDPKASLEFILGQMDGKLGGICREIGEIKDTLRCQTQDCVECKESLKRRIDQGVKDLAMECADENTAMTTRLEKDEADIKILKEAKSDQKAVDTFLNGTAAKVGGTVGIFGGIIAIILKIWSWLTGGPFP